LDANRLQDVAPRWIKPLTRILTSGVSAVLSSEALREQAVLEHLGNVDVPQRSEKITFADEDPEADQRAPEDRFDDDGVRLRGSRLISPSSYRTEILAGNAAIFGVSGWWDGAYARAAAQRFNAAPTQGSQLLLGPWTHTASGILKVRTGPPGADSITTGDCCISSTNICVAILLVDPANRPFVTSRSSNRNGSRLKPGHPIPFATEHSF